MPLPTKFNIATVQGIKGDRGDPGPAGPAGVSGGAKTYTASGTLTKGDLYCGTSTPGTVKKATAANLANAPGGVLGFVPANTADGATFTAPFAPDVPATVTILGAGVASWITLNTTTARAQRSAILSGGEIILGTCDTLGNMIFVPPVQAAGTAPMFSWNPKAFGCPWDGVHDDLPGLLAMQAAIKVVNGVGHGMARVDLPPGMGYCSDDLDWTVPAEIHGRGGNTPFNQTTSSGIQFPPLKGLKLHHIATAPGVVTTAGEGGRADGSSLHKVTIQSTNCIVSPTNQGLGANIFQLDGSFTTRAPRVGQWIEKGVCVTRGGCITDPPAQWQANHPYVAGQFVWAPLSSFAHDFVFKCTGSGTSSGGSENAVFGTSSPFLESVGLQYSGRVITDGSAQWTAYDYADPEAPGPEVMFRCVTAGTITGNSEPGGFASAGVADIGTVINDTGGVQWKVEGIPKTYRNNKAYVVGQRTFYPGQNQIVAECIVAGTSRNDGQPPGEMVVSGPGQTFFDNGIAGLKWKTIIPAGVAVYAPYCYLDKCTIMGATGNAVIATSVLDPSGVTGGFGSAENFIFHGGSHVNWCGAGVLLHGSDCNGCDVSGIDFQRLGAGRHHVNHHRYGTGAFAVQDQGLVNSVHNNYCQFGECPAYTNQQANFDPVTYNGAGGSNGTWRENRSENSLPDFFTGCVVYNNSFVSDASPAEVHTFTANKGYTEVDNTEGHGLTASLLQLLQGDVAFPMSASTDDGNQVVAWRYQINSNNAGPIGNGWWGHVYGPAQNSQTAAGISSTIAAEGPGHWQVPIGQFQGGSTNGRYYRGFDLKAVDSNFIRGGQRKRGDRFQKRSAGTSGLWEERICQADGWIGPAWAAGLHRDSTSGAVYGIFADVRVPSAVSTTPTTFDADGIAVPGTKVFQATVQAADTTEPDWSTAPNLNDTVVHEGVTWKNVGTVPAFGHSAFHDDFVVGLTPQAKTKWGDTADTDPATAAPKAFLESQRFTYSSSAVTANQVAATFALPSNSCESFNVTVVGKIAGSTNAWMNKGAAGFVNNAGTITRLGADDIGTAKENGTLVGSSFNLNINGGNIEVRITPAVVTATNWTVIVENAEVRD